MAGGKDRLLSVREAAEQLGLCTATVYGLCAEGALPHIRILNAIRIAPADLVAFIDTRRIGTAPGQRDEKAALLSPRDLPDGVSEIGIPE